MAKVKHSSDVLYFAGQVDGAVYGPAIGGTYSIRRRYVIPAYTTQNQTMGTIMRNLAVVWDGCHADYVQDGTDYAARFRSENEGQTLMYSPPTNGFAHFVKMMFAWQASDPTHVDLSVVTIADIISLDADVRTWTRAIDAKFLPQVDGYGDFNHPINGA